MAMPGMELGEHAGHAPMVMPGMAPRASGSDTMGDTSVGGMDMSMRLG
jgi:hypothetical protein